MSFFSSPLSRRWQHHTRFAPAVSGETAIAKGAFSSLELRRDSPRLHSFLQIRHYVWYNSLFGDEDDRLHHQQEEPPNRPEPIGGAEAGEVLTDLLPVLISEKGPAEQEEETCKQKLRRESLKKIPSETQHHCEKQKKAIRVND